MIACVLVPVPYVVQTIEIHVYRLILIDFFSVHMLNIKLRMRFI